MPSRPLQLERLKHEKLFVAGLGSRVLQRLCGDPCHAWRVALHLLGSFQGGKHAAAKAEGGGSKRLMQVKKQSSGSPNGLLDRHPACRQQLHHAAKKLCEGGCQSSPSGTSSRPNTGTIALHSSSTHNLTPDKTPCQSIQVCNLWQSVRFARSQRRLALQLCLSR
mgnify:CR=1 FL=1